MEQSKTVPGFFFYSVFLELCLYIYVYFLYLVAPFGVKHSLEVCIFMRLAFAIKTFACSDDNQVFKHVV